MLCHNQRGTTPTMPVEAPTQLHPTSVTYRDHVIVLTHRPRTNDWEYAVRHTRTILLRNVAPRYETALKQAKRDLDIVLGKA